MKEKYLICSDLYGTLLNSKGEISSNTLSIIRNLQKDGHIFCISTGRMYKSAKSFADIIGGDTCIICSNGAYAGTATEDIHKSNMSPETAINVYKVMQFFNIPLYFFSKNDVYYTKVLPLFFSKEDMQRLSTGSNVNGMKPILTLDNFKEHLGNYLNAIAIEEEDLSLLKKAKTELKKLSGIYVQSSYFNNIEIIPHGTDKGLAVKKIQEHFNIKRENIIAFGDGENDLSMLKYAGIGVAMDNSTDEVKKCADRVTLNNNDEGVYHTLKEIFSK